MNLLLVFFNEIPFTSPPFGEIHLSHTYSRKKEQAVAMDTKSIIRVQDDHVHVYPQLLFQRLVTLRVNDYNSTNSKVQICRCSVVF